MIRVMLKNNPGEGYIRGRTKVILFLVCITVLHSTSCIVSQEANRIRSNSSASSISETPKKDSVAFMEELKSSLPVSREEDTRKELAGIPYYYGPLEGWLFSTSKYLLDLAPMGTRIQVSPDPSRERQWRLYKLTTPFGEKISWRAAKTEGQYTAVPFSISVVVPLSPSTKDPAPRGNTLIQGYYWYMNKSDLEKVVNSALVSISKDKSLSSGAPQTSISARIEWSDYKPLAGAEKGVVDSWIGKMRNSCVFIIIDDKLVGVYFDIDEYDAYLGKIRVSPPQTENEAWRLQQ